MSDGGGSGLSTLLMFLFFFGVMAFMVALVVVQHRALERRREAMQAMAARLQFSFTPDPGSGLVPELSQFSLFQRGHSRQPTNLMQGSTGEVELKVFDYRYTTGSGKHSSTHRQTVLLLRAPGLDLPAFELQPEHMLHRLGNLVGVRDVDVEDDAAFSETYWVRGQDEEAIRTTFRPEVRATYLRRTGLCTQAAGQEIVLFRSEQRVEPEAIQSFVEEGLDVVAAFKRQEGALTALDLWGLDLEPGDGNQEVEPETEQKAGLEPLAGVN